ncbi:hypothetical protein Q7P36_009529 [Cladosporium allicinum]
MVKPVLLTAALLGLCAAAPLSTSDSSSSCFNATIRKEYLLKLTTYQPYNPYSPAVNNLERISLSIANPTNENQNAITCTDAKWNSTNQPFPEDAITCSDPTFSYKLTSYTDNSTFSLVINQTFVQGPFTQTILASYNATLSDLNGYACFKGGCNAYYQGGRQGRALVYDVQKNGPPSTSFPDQCPPSPIPHPAAWPIRYTSKISDPKNPSSPPVLSSLGFDLLTNAQNGYRMVCNGPEWDPTTTTTAQPADWFPCPSKPSIPGSWSFRVESYTDYQTFNLAIRQWVCSEVQCQTNLAYANLTSATRDERFSICDPWGTCTSESAGKTVDAPIYGVTNLTVIE